MAMVICMISAKIDKLIFTEFLPEMFKRVGLKASDINDLKKQPNWFTTQSWTEEDELNFKQWLVKRLMHRMRMTKASAEKEADFFLLSFGWSTGVPKQLNLPIE